MDQFNNSKNPSPDIAGRAENNKLVAESIASPVSELDFIRTMTNRWGLTFSKSTFVQHSEDVYRFSISKDGPQVGKIDYRITDNGLVIDDMKVQEAYRGKNGFGSLLVALVLSEEMPARVSAFLGDTNHDVYLQMVKEGFNPHEATTFTPLYKALSRFGFARGDPDLSTYYMSGVTLKTVRAIDVGESCPKVNNTLYRTPSPPES